MLLKKLRNRFLEETCVASPASPSDGGREKADFPSKARVSRSDPQRSSSWVEHLLGNRITKWCSSEVSRMEIASEHRLAVKAMMYRPEPGLAPT